MCSVKIFLNTKNIDCFAHTQLVTSWDQELLFAACDDSLWFCSTSAGSCLVPSFSSHSLLSLRMLGLHWTHTPLLLVSSSSASHPARGLHRASFTDCATPHLLTSPLHSSATRHMHVTLVATHTLLHNATQCHSPRHSAPSPSRSLWIQPP